MNIQNIHVDLLYVSDLNVRKNLSSGPDETSIQNLAESIRKDGLLCPLTVRQRGSRFEVIAGQRRLASIKKYLTMSNVPCNVVDLSDNEVIELSLVENIQRNQMCVKDKVIAFSKLYDLYNNDIKKLSRNLNVSVPTLTRYIHLCRLPEPILNLLDYTSENGKKKLTIEVASKLVKLLKEDLEKYLGFILSVTQNLHTVHKIKAVKYVISKRSIVGLEDYVRSLTEVRVKVKKHGPRVTVKIPSGDLIESVSIPEERLTDLIEYIKSLA